ncbi:MAG TPA: diguanylate cyclase, partial [Terriglobales bacterium]
MSELQDPQIFRTILDTLQTGVYVVDRDRRIIFWNEGAEHSSGYLRQDVLGRPCSENILAHCDNSGTPLCKDNCPLAATLLDGRKREARLYMRHKGGHRLPVKVWTVPVRNSHGTIIAAAESFEELTVHCESESFAQQLAAHGCLDPVTGLPNQAFTQSRLREQLVLFGQHHLRFTIFLVEVQREDLFTAAHGRAATDLMMHSVALTVAHALQPSDYLGRWTGDRLLVILNGQAGSSEEALSSFCHLVKHSEIEWWGDQLTASGSVGQAQAAPGDT